MAAKKKRITKKKRTLSEFRAWLEGVEELQGDDWCPDADQWKLIRAAIDGIVEEAPPEPAPAPAAGNPYDRAPEQQYHPAPAPAPVPGPAPQQSTMLPVGDSVEMTPAAKAALNGGAPPPSMTPDPDGKLKTPNLDTTNGDYNSGFE